ncbi:hypothetical protein PENFLA_c002G02090 [Penicillium flavigenum]|uniref:Uncharacterized protein n=1 Tax=Penicillium flavigenum TaxID=254877 RepID=A0A1V6TYP7_9EURO|nr:hypothetical protein PENFLA_c002G02090 [Penicillium flavigenum]
MRSLPCLCGRRDNLAILLASKGLWNDAAPIFWTENWFAFEDPSLLTGFLTAIRPQWRDPIWNGWDDIKSCWNLLRLCEGLTELELDVVFLTRKEWAQAIRLICVKRKVAFLRHVDPGGMKYLFEEPTNFVWESHARRKRFDSPTTALLVSSMTGNRAIKRKALINHYSENTLHQICGDYGVEFTEKMIEGRRWNS